MQFLAAGDEVAFDPREIPAQPAVRIGGIRIERNRPLQFAFRQGKIAIVKHGNSAQPDMADARALIIPHGHHCGVPHRTQNFPRCTVGIGDREIGTGQVAPCHRVVRIFSHGFLEQGDFSFETLLIRMCPQSVGPQEKIVRARVRRGRNKQPLLLGRGEFYFQGVGDLLRDLTLHAKNILHVMAVTLRPQMMAAARINELHVDQDVVASFLHAPSSTLATPNSRLSDPRSSGWL